MIRERISPVAVKKYLATKQHPNNEFRIPFHFHCQRLLGMFFKEVIEEPMSGIDGTRCSKEFQAPLISTSDSFDTRCTEIKSPHASSFPNVR